jgi:rhodanese-related sulfurtransferase
LKLGKRKNDTINRITAAEFVKEVKVGESKVVDIRKDSEYSAEHVDEGFSKPLANINEWIKDIDPKEPFFIFIAGGYRSMIAASILQARGLEIFQKLKVVLMLLQNFSNNRFCLPKKTL